MPEYAKNHSDVISILNPLNTTVIGHIVNDPQRRKIGDQELIKFRLASNSRRRTPDGDWESGNSLFITVNCWGKLVTGVGAALSKGSPVIAFGHVYTSEYDDRDGNRRSSTEMRAISVGPDLSRAIVRILTPVPQPAPSAIQDSESSPATASDVPEGSSDATEAVSALPVPA